MRKPNLGVAIVGFIQELVVFEVVSEERSRSHDLFTSHNDNFLAVQQFLGYVRSKSSKQVPSCVYYNLLFKHA